MSAPETTAPGKGRRGRRAGLLSSLIWRGHTGNSSMTLTFDDGPHPVYTERILEILARHRVPAAFFPLGRHAERHPHLIRMISSQGHLIGNHTYRHRHLIFLSRETVREELLQCSRLIADITGQRPRFFRPPRGLFGWNALREASRMGMRTVLWTCSPRDWTQPGATTIARRVLSGSRRGAIVLLHDAKYDDPEENRDQTVRALPVIIDGLRNQGYRLVSLPELIAGRPAPEIGPDP